MINDDAPNIHIQKRMIELLSSSLTLNALNKYERVPAKGIRYLLEKLHILSPKYKYVGDDIPSTKTIRVKRHSNIMLPDKDEDDGNN